MMISFVVLKFPVQLVFASCYGSLMPIRMINFGGRLFIDFEIVFGFCF